MIGFILNLLKLIAEKLGISLLVSYIKDSFSGKKKNSITVHEPVIEKKVVTETITYTETKTTTKTVETTVSES